MSKKTKTAKVGNLTITTNAKGQVMSMSAKGQAARTLFNEILAEHGLEPLPTPKKS